VFECDLILTSLVKLTFENSVSYIVTGIHITLYMYQIIDISSTSHTHTLYAMANMITELCLGFEIAVTFRNTG
jgi:LEA14-like dessication related protein